MSRNKIAYIIQIISGIVIALGIFLGIAVAAADNPMLPYSSFGFTGFMVVAIPCIISGVLLFGFAEIISLLQQIRDGEKLGDRDNTRLPEL